MAFTEYPLRDGERVAEVMHQTHEVRTAVASLQELLAQIDEQIKTLEHAKSLAKDEVQRVLLAFRA